MGFFSRNEDDNNESDDIFDTVELPNSSDLTGDDPIAPEGNTIISKPAAQPLQAQSFSSRPHPAYGIEEAIRLMRDLPRDNTEVVVTVVKKTLESTQIHLKDIIVDADQKESRIRNEHKTLEQEIKDLQEQIAQRNHTISNLLADLKETEDVKERLNLALELDTPKQTKSTAPQPAIDYTGDSNSPPNPQPSQQTSPEKKTAEADNKPLASSSGTHTASSGNDTKRTTHRSPRQHAASIRQQQQH